MNLLILLPVFFALGFVAVHHDAFATSDCDDPHCRAVITTGIVDGLEYELDSPDLYVDRSACGDTAVSTGWMVGTKTYNDVEREWMESGVVKGNFKNEGCVTILSTYYGFNFVSMDMSTYQEYLVPNGRVDPGDDVTVKMQRNTSDLNQLQVFVTTPDRSSVSPLAQLSFQPNTKFTATFGIEGSILRQTSTPLFL